MPKLRKNNNSGVRIVEPKKKYNPNAPSYRIRRAVAQLNREAKARGDRVFKKVVLRDCLKSDE